MTARRLAPILAADIVGYSRLMGEDEAGTAKIVRERRKAAAKIVRAFGGRLVKTTGDGVLLEFPSVVAVVESAIVIQKTMAERNAALPETKRILYRIGRGRLKANPPPSSSPRHPIVSESVPTRRRRRSDWRHE